MLASKHRAKATLLMMTVAIVAVLIASPVAAQLLLDDPLQGSTSGTQGGGSFVAGGWQVTGDYDSIYWHLPYGVSKGAAEFYVTGISNTYPHKTEHFHMYDYTFGSADTVYAPGYRDNPYKHFVRKSGVADGAKNGSCEIVYAITPNFFELDTAVLAWSPSTNYKFRVEWGPEGGNSRLNVFRDGVNILSNTVPGNYTPAGHSVRIGCSPRRALEGSEIGAKYSYFKAWDMTNAIPAAPTVTTPTSGGTMKSNIAFIKWSGNTHDRYQVRVCYTDNPDTSIAWDSGEVMSSRDWAYTGALGNMTNHYVFVKIGSASGWSGWSANGYWFRVDSSYSGSNNVLVQGNTLWDNNGPFLGVGFTYFRSLQLCKYDRTRWASDLAAMSSMGFNYQRILSSVDWAGLEIAPVAFGSVPAWPDYWAQFDYDIDTAYDTYGLRTEVTIFAGAQNVFPTDPARYTHMDTILAHCNARPHKVVQIEVVNEGWQNGFPDESVTRDFCQYLADRTSIPVSITCPVDRSDAGIQAMYSSGPADIATVHFSRTLNGVDGHWEPVIDCWRVPALYPGVPPTSSNEPIGSGSSVSTEDHANHLAAAGAFAWIANLPMYVYHSRAGVWGDVTFEASAGFAAYRYMQGIIPADVASWIRNDGKESAAPFTAYSMGQANKYWTDVGGATNGCHRNIGGRKGIEFICFTQGVLGGGVTLEARQQVTFRVYDPLTGALVMDTTTKNAAEQINLAMGNEIYVIKGAYGPTLPAPPGGNKTLNSRGSATITVDGATSDWNLSEFTTLVRGGQSGTGDIALTGFDGGSLYYGSYYTGGVLPTSASDHTAKVYSRNTSTYLYFLVRCDDNDMRYNNPVGDNWMNDCVEFYIDPSHDHGGVPMSNSTSDIQLVIDANNQKNVYMTTTGYATQVLAGVTSAVVRDGTGWWLEARIAKSALDPDVPAAGNTVGVDFNFRDNDNNNDWGLSTVYDWSDTTYNGMSKVPALWGDCFLDATQTPYSGVIAIPGTVQAENYDIGGQNVSFYDTTPGNAGGLFRTDDIDIFDAVDTGGGYCIGAVDTAEWAEYTVNVATNGDYSVKFRVATANGGPNVFHAELDGNNITGSKSCDTTFGWQNWTTIIAPARYLTAGQHILRVKFDSGVVNLNNVEFASNGADAVSIDLGSPDVEDGMTHIQVADGDTIPWTSAGHYCRENVDYPDIYMYFGVADAYSYQGSKQNLNITFDYYDIGTATLGLDYDSTSSSYQHINGPTLTNTLGWKSYTFTVN
ncbi:MAG: sugar-binding protein, partial [Armatimonadota bacterium]|nr:sugar-binding protein [Armatimonadota bacterium]